MVHLSLRERVALLAATADTLRQKLIDIPELAADEVLDRAVWGAECDLKDAWDRAQKLETAEQNARTKYVHGTNIVRTNPGANTKIHGL